MLVVYQDSLKYLFLILLGNKDNGHYKIAARIRPFNRVRKITKKEYQLRHALPLVRSSFLPSALKYSASTGRIFTKFYI